MINIKYQALSTDYIRKKKELFLTSAIGVLLILVFLGMRGKIQDFLFFEITKGENLEKPNLELYYASLKPFRNWNVEPLEIKTPAALSVEINQSGETKFLYAKNVKKKLAIASLTKLMTAYLALENYDLNQEVIISAKADLIEGNSANLRVGERFYVKDLIYSLLLESSNESAQTLAEIMGETQFLNLMNQKAQELGLKNTYFVDPIGLDPDSPSVSPNYSTAEDLAVLTSQLLKNPLIKQIFKTERFELYTTNGLFHHQIENNNELLKDSEIFWKDKILGAKTGWTPFAGQCLLLILESPRLRQSYDGQSKNNSIIINIVLNSPNRFEEMKQLVNWVYSAYKW